MTVHEPVAPVTTDHPQKLERLRGVLAARPPGTRLVLTSPEMLAWYLDGAHVAIALNGAPIVAATVSLDDDRLYCFDNEAGRMLEEELPEGLGLVRVPWHRPLTEAIGPQQTDVAESALVPELRAARASLLPLELERYRSLCRDAARELTDVLATARPELSERDLAARVTERVVAIGADPLVVLVAGADRLPHRHPLPTPAPLGRRAMVVVCARRHGMIANLTRWITFGEATTEERVADAAILEVEAAVLDATRPGVGIDVPFRAVTEAYGRAGFSADEWTRHHQGGPTGYVGRDPRAVPGATDPIVDNHAFAWNPSAPGAKVEDTVLATADGIELLTVDPRWPTTLHAGRPRPTALHL